MITKKTSSRCSTLAEALEAAIAHSSLEVLNGERQLYALVSDFLRADLQGRQSLNLLRNAIQVGVPARIYGAIGKDSGTQNVTLAACRKLLMDSYGVSEEAAGQFVNSFATALGWKISIELTPEKPMKINAVTGAQSPRTIPAEERKSVPLVPTAPIQPPAAIPVEHILNDIAFLQSEAAQGNADAQYNLGYLYEKGEAVIQDYAKAVQLYQLAANQEHTCAQFRLGRCYDLGVGIKQNYANAAQWYRIAADKGQANAQNNLGALYASGDGVKKDNTQAARLYRLAADQGLAAAQINIGSFCEKGICCEKDCAKAAEWYLLAVHQGEAAAQVNLGLLYEFGDGVRQDYAKAAELYRLAADQGYAGAAKALKRVSRKL